MISMKRQTLTFILPSIMLSVQRFEGHIQSALCSTRHAAGRPGTRPCLIPDGNK